MPLVGGNLPHRRRVGDFYAVLLIVMQGRLGHIARSYNRQVFVGDVGFGVEAGQVPDGYRGPGPAELGYSRHIHRAVQQIVRGQVGNQFNLGRPVNIEQSRQFRQGLGPYKGRGYNGFGTDGPPKIGKILGPRGPDQFHARHIAATPERN